MIKAVVFDLDDTLISERQYIESGYHHIASFLNVKYGLDKEKSYEDLITLFNESAKNVFNRLLDKYNIDYSKEEIIELVKEYRNHPPQISFYDDVTPCLEILKKLGIKLGIITDGYANSQRLKLKAVNAANYFDEIIVTDEIGRDYWKPHPKAFELMKEKFQIEFDEMIYVGDNPEKDFYISSKYPIKTIQIKRKDGVYDRIQYLCNITPFYKVNSLLDILIAFGSGGKK